MSTDPRPSLNPGPFSTNSPEMRDAGNFLGRWVSGPQGECGVVVACLGPDLVGHARYHVALLDEQRHPVDDEVIVISSRWSWKFLVPDREKMSREELGRLRDGLQAALVMEREKRSRKFYASQEALEQLRSAYEERRPPGTQAVIVAELWRHRKGFASRTVFLAWSQHTRNQFSELHQAAAAFGPTVDLAVGPQENEHREERNPGHKYHFSLWNSGEWRVCKLPADCPIAWKAEWNAPESLPTTSAASPKS